MDIKTLNKAKAIYHEKENILRRIDIIEKQEGKADICLNSVILFTPHDRDYQKTLSMIKNDLKARVVFLDSVFDKL